ncbi:MAG: 2-oxo acid dehydrogenase subunit E2 [Candidatus Omnitrophica bacterium]|nr:2-oxo acid dehydrogenase subunit E2 [Candidatus Omnitrophota bacterium]
MDVKIPVLAENVTSGIVVKLFVSQGDDVKQGDDLLELETEKAVAAIPAPATGKINTIHVKEGDSVKVGQTVITLAEAGEKAPAAAPSVAPATPKPQAAPAPAAPAPLPEIPAQKGSLQPAGVPPPAPPSIRKAAHQLGLDLSRIRGSEHGGRITWDDVKNYIQTLERIAFAPKEGGAAAVPSARKAAPEPVDFSKWGPVRVQPMSTLRKKISEKMAESWTTVPHVTQFDEADISVPQRLIETHGPAYQKQGARLTLTAVILKALAGHLKKHPIFNASINEAAGEIVFKDYCHLGLAVDTEQGLIVPVLRDVDKKSLLELSKQIQDLAARTRERKIALDELMGGTFTVSNQGGIGGGHFTPIIRTPEVAILGVGRAVERPVARKAKIEVRPILPLALSYDHRLIDGASAARFIKEFVQALENFEESAVAIGGDKGKKTQQGTAVKGKK